MAHVLLDGQVSSLARGSETFGAMRAGRGIVNSNQMTSFRIGGKPAQLKSKQLVAIADGDLKRATPIWRDAPRWAIWMPLMP